MLFLSFVATYRASDICQGANVISCVTLVNLVWIILVIALHILEGRKKNPHNLLVGYDTGKEKKVIIDLRSVTNRLLEMLFHCENRSRLTAEIWNIYVLISGLFRWYHTGTPVDQLGVGGGLWALIIFSPIFSWNASSRRYVLSGRLPGSHINVWNPFPRYELKIYAVSLPRFPTVARRKQPSETPC